MFSRISSSMSGWTQICLITSLLAPQLYAQSLSNCHRHGSTEYCYGPDGQETPVTTHLSAPSTAPNAASATPTATNAAQTTAITGCHLHATKTYVVLVRNHRNSFSHIDSFCIAGDGKEVQVTGPAGPNTTPPTQYTDCHRHGSKLYVILETSPLSIPLRTSNKDADFNPRYCVGPNNEEVEVLAAEASSPTGGHDGHNHGNDHDQQELDCHFHAGVEIDRNYNVPYRIGSLFAILITSGIAVFAPVLWKRFSPSTASASAFLIIKQFGTGVMVATAFIHLLTHAQLTFANRCLGRLQYEATATAIMMAGLFLTFLLEYFGHRVMASRIRPESDREGSVSSSTQQANQKDSSTTCAVAPEMSHQHAPRSDKLSVILMEAGIVFHSIILGLTLVVAGDSAYTPLFIVIIFHQMFEGLALGSRIADLAKMATGMKLIMATIFTLITPIGMAIGLGVRKTFNGNDRSTIIAIGTLDSFSAGILTWASLVNMWGHDWIYGEFRQTGVMKTCLGMLSLLLGMIAMAVLGKWA
ncbi:ZIP Zinc transporter family protein [Coccidioides posadasii C735 delta SOWgp]|uniref:ZIP Zinc transporter family protein n=1 Tax=Coccidioides posadasii (strain C735) TaxID=222929 RepID=C5P3F9_COCP7|nr:ZIP Zinc transporter family protein [Coccidioides posadasii C735 delta SOWgp]EER28227.1 ZIP Zinc transporter family protein [Coccidioides posadasii C735 delta SOWgp]|eukprot:XP_003070372.1 ZIP Zinc transporter family protein [Coccidioides posadasii C735 delta SOWgp]